jgi:carbamoylphosphate synthase large subunit
MYFTLEDNGIDLPEYYACENIIDTRVALSKLGFPKNRVVMKPQVGKGSRGVRIIDDYVNRYDLLMEEKPSHKFITLPELRTTLKYAERYPKLLLMEYLDEPKLGQRTVDAVCLDGELLYATVKTVEKARWGVIVSGELVRDDGLIEQSREILKHIPLSYCVNLQFIGDKLIEINPRVSTFIYQDGVCPPYLAIQLALGNLSKDEVKANQDKVQYGRRFTRYMDQVFYDA